MDNHLIAQQLMQRARYLAGREGSLFRVRAYRRAAETVLGLETPLERVFVEHGRHGLEELPGIGRHIARTLETLVRTGELPNLNDAKPRPEPGPPGESRGSEDPSCNACGASSK